MTERYAHARRVSGLLGALALGAVAVAVLGSAGVACDNQKGTFVYRGRKYDPEKKCLDDLRALDVIEVEMQPALCAPVCLVQKDYDGGDAVYVSDVCPPYPPGFDTSGSHPLCAPALLAFDTRGGCLPEPPDASADADAAPADASSDTGTDADVPDGSDAGTDADAPDANDAASDASDAAG